MTWEQLAVLMFISTSIIKCYSKTGSNLEMKEDVPKAIISIINKKIHFLYYL